MDNKSKLISIKEAASLLGVTTLTLRNWDKNGKLKALRHPMNNYRVYRREEVEGLIEDISSSRVQVKQTTKKAPRKLQVKHLED